HPDNAAPAILGGATIAYVSEGTARAARIPVRGIAPTAIVPVSELSTSRSRGALPSYVSHSDAASSSARSGLLALALSGQPELLLAAAEDRLHQSYRADVVPETAGLLALLRADGIHAVVSGAGPGVLVLSELARSAVEQVPRGRRVQRSAIVEEG